MAGQDEETMSCDVEDTRTMGEAHLQMGKCLCIDSLYSVCM